MIVERGWDSIFQVVAEFFLVALKRELVDKGPGACRSSTWQWLRTVGLPDVSIQLGIAFICSDRLLLGRAAGACVAEDEIGVFTCNGFLLCDIDLLPCWLPGFGGARCVDILASSGGIFGGLAGRFFPRCIRT